MSDDKELTEDEKRLEMEKAQLMATLGLTLEDLPAAMKRLEEGVKQDEEEADNEDAE